jgi:hypothetical protein
MKFHISKIKHLIYLLFIFQHHISVKSFWDITLVENNKKNNTTAATLVQVWVGLWFEMRLRGAWNDSKLF